MLCHYKLSDDEKLKASVTRLLQDVPDKPLPAKMLIWLGLQRQRVGDYHSTNQFLSLASTPEEPLMTELSIWRQLTKARIYTGYYEDALESIEFVLNEETDDNWIADAHLDKATSLSRLSRAEEAKQVAHKGLELNPKGAIKARLLMIIGDVYMAEKEYETAASHYLNCAQMFIEDKKVKPLAIYKAMQAYEKLGTQEKVDLFKYELDQEFPGWTPPVYAEATKAVVIEPSEADQEDTKVDSESTPEDSEKRSAEEEAAKSLSEIENESE